MWKAHFGDPQLPKPWPLYLCYLHCLPVSPAQISGWAHFWPSWPLAWNANKSDLAQNVPAYPELSFPGQSSQSTCFLWLLRISQAPPSPLILVLPPKPFRVSPMNSFRKASVCRGSREASRGWEIVASLGHYSMTPTCLTWEQQSWRCKTENLYRTVRIFFFLLDTLSEIREKVVKSQNPASPSHCLLKDFASFISLLHTSWVSSTCFYANF